MKRQIEAIVNILFPPISLVTAYTHRHKFDSAIQLGGGLGSALLPGAVFANLSLSEALGSFLSPFLGLGLIPSVATLYLATVALSMFGRFLGFLAGYFYTEYTLKGIDDYESYEHYLKSAVEYMFVGNALADNFYFLFVHTHPNHKQFFSEIFNTLDEARLLRPSLRKKHFKMGITLQTHNFLQSIRQLTTSPCIQELLDEEQRIPSEDNQSFAEILLSYITNNKDNPLPKPQDEEALKKVIQITRKHNLFYKKPGDELPKKYYYTKAYPLIITILANSRDASDMHHAVQILDQNGQLNQTRLRKILINKGNLSYIFVKKHLDYGRDPGDYFDKLCNEPKNDISSAFSFAKEHHLLTNQKTNALGLTDEKDYLNNRKKLLLENPQITKFFEYFWSGASLPKTQIYFDLLLQSGENAQEVEKILQALRPLGEDFLTEENCKKILVHKKYAGRESRGWYFFRS